MMVSRLWRVRSCHFLVTGLYPTVKGWLQRLIDRELAGPQPADEGIEKTLVTPGSSPLVPSAPASPGPGALCMGPGCWQRDTARYGLRRMPLCPACRAALKGRTCQREIPPSAARLMRRGAA